MYFKINKSSPLFEKLCKLKDKAIKCNDAALKLVQELGYKEFKVEGDIAGGISMIKIEGRAPKGWQRVSKKSPGFMPKLIPENLALWKKIKALPQVDCRDINKIVKFDGEYINETTNQICFLPAVQWLDSVVLMKIPDWISEYKPVAGMTEIKASEYYLLLEGSKAKKKAKK